MARTFQSETKTIASNEVQTDLAHQLLRPDAFQHRCKYLKLLETHISWILLTGDYAYKIKKPVKLPFVDYSTASQRKAFCHREYKLNSQMAPNIYLGVVPIMRGAREPNVDGDGLLIDCAVKMREFPQECIFDAMLKSNRLEFRHIDQLAKLIARAHREAEIATDDDTKLFREKLQSLSLDNLEFLDDTFSEGKYHATVKKLVGWVEKEFGRLRPIFQSRIENGFVRMCHGDMHLQNVIVFNDKAQVFDCIEFSRELQFVDCINDVAFPIMDLLAQGRPDYAHRLLTLYLEQSGDYDGLAVLDFYMVYRALVRAKVSLMKASNADALRQAETYLKTAEQLIERPAPRLWITCGVSGSGKSTESMRLVEKTGAIRIRSDVERNRMFGEPSNGKKYSLESTEEVYDRLHELATRILEKGYSVIVDATFLEQQRRAEFLRLARDQAALFAIVHCEAELETLLRRVRDRTGDASQATADVIEKQIAEMDALSVEEQLLVSKSDDERKIPAGELR